MVAICTLTWAPMTFNTLGFRLLKSTAHGENLLEVGLHATITKCEGLSYGTRQITKEPLQIMSSGKYTSRDVFDIA
jgi:hypothetical protein